MSDEQPASEVYYEVNRPFKYGRVHLRRGDIWEPVDGPWDDQIIDAGMVIKRKRPAPKPAKTPRQAAAKRGQRTIEHGS